MDVFISIDMEGVAGVATREQCRRGADDYLQGRRLMTAEANAAIAGAVDGGAGRVVVRDAHGDMANLLPDELDARAELLHGSPSPLSMMEGIEESDFEVALFVGYHAGAGIQEAVLAHTYSGASFADVRLDGHSVTEAELNALVAGAHGVPVGLVTGDDRICSVAAERFPGVRTAAVKAGRGFTLSRSKHPEVACDLIRRESEAAVRDAGSLTPITPDGLGSLELEVDLTDLRRAELCAMPPGVQRSGRTVTVTGQDPVEAFRWLRTFVHLAAAA